MLTILIADDEQHIREGIANSVNWHELQIDMVFQAMDGEQAYQIALENKIDILLTDIRMPIVDGIQLSKEILKLYPDCIIIFMSAYSDKEYLMSAIKLKASNYLEKPHQIGKLRDVLDEAVKKYRENEYNKLKSIMVENNYKISMPLIKNEIALLSINKNTDMNLLMDCIKNEILGITANTPYITVIIKTVDFFDHNVYEPRGRNSRAEFFSQLSRVLSSKGLLCFYGTRDEEEYIVHIYGSRDFTFFDQKIILSLLELWLSQLKNKKLFVSIGTVVPDFTHIYKSYEGAKAALKKCFFRGYGSIVSYVHEIARIEIIEKEIIAQFTEAIEGGKNDFAFQLVQDFSVQLFKYENADIDEIKNVYCKLMAILLNSLQNYGISYLSKYENDNTIRNEIYLIHTLDELDKFSKELMEAYFNTVKQIKNTKSISLIIIYIENNYADKTLDINKISEHTFLSPAYMCTYFKRETGKTINQYITDYRLNKAAEFLKDKKFRISEVAGLIGYDDNYFARIFKKKFGTSPSEYRERLGYIS